MSVPLSLDYIASGWRLDAVNLWPKKFNLPGISEYLQLLSDFVTDVVLVWKQSRQFDFTAHESKAKGSYPLD